MFLRLTADEIASGWPVIKNAIKESRPPMYIGEPEFYTNVLDALQGGAMQCWALLNNRHIKALCVTELISDPYNQKLNLLIFALYGHEALTEHDWAEGQQVLFEFAKSLRCSFVIAYTDHPGIVRMAEQRNASIRQYIQVEVPK